jgi:hypothetical protein
MHSSHPEQYLTSGGPIRAFLEGANRRLTAEYELMVSKYEEKLSEQKATLDRQAKQAESESVPTNSLIKTVLTRA